MSDYLWDKTGEPEADVERLEEMLGQLRFQPRPLELQPELPARDFRAARVRNLLSWPRLAVAASLAAALLVGAGILLSDRRTTTTGDAPQQLAGANDKRGVEQGKSQPATTPKDDDIKQPQANPAPDEKSARLPQKPRRPDLASSRGHDRHRAPRAARLEAAKHEATPAPRGSPARREEVAQFTKEEREAAEKLLFALRLTSEKLSYARQQVEEAGRREPNR